MNARDENVSSWKPPIESGENAAVLRAVATLQLAKPHTGEVGQTGRDTFWRAQMLTLSQVDLEKTDCLLIADQTMSSQRPPQGQLAPLLKTLASEGDSAGHVGLIQTKTFAHHERSCFSRLGVVRGSSVVTW